MLESKSGDKDPVTTTVKPKRRHRKTYYKRMKEILRIQATEACFVKKAPTRRLMKYCLKDAGIRISNKSVGVMREGIQAFLTDVFHNTEVVRNGSQRIAATSRDMKAALEIKYGNTNFSFNFREIMNPRWTPTWIKEGHSDIYRNNFFRAQSAYRVSDHKHLDRVKKRIFKNVRTVAPVVA